MVMRLCQGILIFLLCCTTVIVSAVQPVTGTIQFPIAINHEAFPFFITGVLFLHNFDYDLARAQFQEASARDPKAAMPYWGLAMTYNHPLWGEVDLQGGRDALKKLGSTFVAQLANVNDAKERGWITAMQALYGEGDKAARDQQYLRAMHDLNRRYPDDHEIAMFYALALLGSTDTNRDFTTYMRAAAIAEDIARKNPHHPGAFHYAIHAFDDPIHAPLGLYYARQYSKIAPDASHALHMPSHIYLSLGMWPDVIESNKRAFAASHKTNPLSEPAKYTTHDVHALQWLSYGYLQLKDYKSALQTIKIMEGIVDKYPIPMMKWYYAMMRAAYFVETQDWRAKLKSYDMTGVELNALANTVYVDSLIHLHVDTKNPDLNSVITKLQGLCKAIPTKEFSHCGEADYFTSVTEGGITAGKIIALELRAQLALQKNDYANAIKLLQQAAALEEKAPFGYGPPSPVKPAYELLGDVYFAKKDYLQAYEAYKKSLSRAPKRTLSEEGLQHALLQLQAANIKLPQADAVPYFNRLMKE